MPASLQQTRGGASGARFPFGPFPTGWYALCFSRELARGGVLGRSFMGREVVVFRGASGRVGVLDAHCPHMGAHLAHGGRVEAGGLRCPMHGFVFDAAGACVATGYGTRPPPKCQANAHHVLEQNGIVLAFHADGADSTRSADGPGWQPPAQDLSGFSPLRTHVFAALPTHPQETTENSVDMGHLAAVHGYRNVEVVAPLKTDGPYLTIRYRVKRRALVRGMPPVDATFTVHVHGLGYSFVDVEATSLGLFTRHFVLCTPTDGAHVDLRLAGCMRAGGLLARVPVALLDRLVGRIVFGGFLSDVRQDLPIWSHKAYVHPPALAQGDGPVGKYRAWARQFYADAGGGPADAEANANANADAGGRPTDAGEHGAGGNGTGQRVGLNTPG